MKKVLFINPNWKEVVSKKGKRYNQVWPPLDLLNCAALLEKNGIEAEVLDLNVRPHLIREASFQASNYQWVFLTSSPLARWQCPHVNIDPFFETTQLLPKNNLSILGVHGTLHPEAILKRSGARLVIQGEPEMTVLDICQGGDLDKTEGIAFIQDGRLIINPPRKLFPLTELPPPAFSKVDVRDYYYEVLGKNVALIETTRGCSFDCFYCLKVMHGGRSFRYKSVDQVKREIQLAIEESGAKAICFIDLEFPVHNREFVSSICQLFLEKNYRVPWSCITRPDLVEINVLHVMKKSGCRLIHFGVETGSKNMMKLIHKNISLDKIRKGIQLTHQAGIHSVCFFMFGLPGETVEDMKKTIAFAKELNPTYASFHVATPYDHTEFYEMVKERLTEPEDFFNRAYTAEFSEEELNRWVRRAFLHFYLRPRYALTRLLQEKPWNWLKVFRLFLHYIR